MVGTDITTTVFTVHYPSGMAVQVHGRLIVVLGDMGLMPMVMNEHGEIVGFDSRAVIADHRKREIVYSPRYHPMEAHEQATQAWLIENPSWGMPGCLPIERGTEQ